MKLKNYLLLITLLSLLLLVCGCGDDGAVNITTPTTPNPTPTTPNPTTTTPNPTSGTTLGTVNGVVYGADSQPAVGVTVTLTPMTSSEAYGEAQTTTTVTNGTFTFSVSYAGTYVVEAKNGNDLLGSQQFTIALGQIVNIFLGQATGKLTVRILPEAAVPNVTNVSITGIPIVETSGLDFTGSAVGDRIFYLPPGTYDVTVSATGYSPETVADIPIVAGSDELREVTFDETNELDITAAGVSPRVCVNTGDVPVRIRGTNFVNPPAVNLIPVAGGTTIPGTGVAIDPNDPNTVTCTFALNGAALGEYTVEIVHDPIASESTATYAGFWVVDTVTAAIDKANEIYISEVLTVSADSSTQIMAYVPAGTYLFTQMITMKSGVHLKGADPNTTILDEQDNSTVMKIKEMTNLTVEGFTLTNGDADEGGGLRIEDSDGVLIKNNRIVDNYAYYYGGGVLCEESNALLEGNIISDNVVDDGDSGDGGGGGVYFWADGYEDLLTMTGNTLQNNSAYYYGGGLYCYTTYGSSVNIVGNTFNGNYTTHYYGGAIYLSTHETTVAYIKGNVITNNYTGNDEHGGGICAYCNGGSTASIIENTVSGNYAGGSSGCGGGLYMRAAHISTANINNNNFTDNDGDLGGAMCLDKTPGATFTVDGNNISGNGSSNTTRGGGIYFSGAGYNKTTITENNINGNTIGGTDGQQLYYEGSATLDADNNWWGAGVTFPNDAQVYDTGTPTVDVGTPATAAFPIPVTP